MRWVGFVFMALAFIWAVSFFVAHPAMAQGGQAAPSSQSPCSTLTADEQQFAFGLTPQNRQVFCSKFTPVQRAAAMQLTSQPDPTGALLSPDDAVQKVVDSMNISPNSQGTGVCPSK